MSESRPNGKAGADLVLEWVRGLHPHWDKVPAPGGGWSAPRAEGRVDARIDAARRRAIRVGSGRAAGLDRLWQSAPPQGPGPHGEGRGSRSDTEVPSDLLRAQQMID